ncbi:ATP-binding cassette subfamily B protein [Brachybacterium muris]|uniref:ABC transporter ATP-binding protein n=2 Tax=Brachybacterium muris TaxID=219301 RepID=UPI00195BE75D|nr:ABC transporter ATP-binding protein [Brachybacterium muris]MBM7502253.1 ATP-binding cassette subfamily B protein [Brachybacterium muris]MCT1429751.1 ABC transporter ATP-binding protein/permease [Brachybacterium muris]
MAAPRAEDQARKKPKPTSSKAKKGKLDPSALRRTLAVIRPHLPRHLALCILGMIALLADVVFRVLEPWPLKFAVDAVTSALGANIPQSTLFGLDIRGTVVAAALGLVVIIAGRAGANYLSTVSFAKVGARIATELRTRVFDHVQSLSLRYHSRASIGDTSQRLVGDVGRLQDVAVTAGLPLVGNVITLAVLLVVMVILDPLLSAVVVAAALCYLLLSRRSSPKIVTASRSTRKGEGSLVGAAAEALGAIRVVQSYGLEKTVAHEFAGGNEKAMKAGVKAKKLAAGLERSTDVLVGFAQAAVLLIGSLQVLRGAMTPGDMVLFLMYLKIAMKPLRDMAKYTGRIARASASGERIADLLDEQVEIADPERPVPMRQVRGTVEFKAITSPDGHGRPLFEGLDLKIPAGQHIGILGPSGGGKSTLVSYLLRLAEPQHGRIRVGGYDTRSVSLGDLRRHVAILPQESVLFSVSVRENIRFGRRDASDSEIEEAARRAGAHDFIVGLPEGYDTVLGNRGDTLSGGQRQRIAIARAMIRRAPVVVLDEATTGLDPASKAQVNESLRELARSRTTISITHDATTVAGLDRVLWLEDGQILEDGTPAQLAADPDSRYARWILEQRTAEQDAEQVAEQVAEQASGRSAGQITGTDTGQEVPR